MSDSNQKELVSKVKRLVDRRYGGNYERAFRTYQSKNTPDASVDATELEQLLKDAGVGNVITRGAWVRGVMARVDADGDGKITWSEFQQVIRRP